MSWNMRDNVGATVTERGFTVENNGRTVPGVYWSPVGVESDRLALLGHGGGAHKKADYIELIAHGLCGLGVSAMAIDGFGYGDRPDAGDYGDGTDDFAARWNSGGGTGEIVADWRAALDFIEAEEDARLTGYLGFSMGTMMGLPLCVAEERVSVAVLGLMGLWGPNKADLADAAPAFDLPVRFLVQWDDEVVPRSRCFDLFGELGSDRKSMHVNPGIHRNVPTFEVQASVRYLADQLAKRV